jgi:hypothetical protein
MDKELLNKICGQDCATYLKFMGYGDFVDGVHYNTPWEPDAKHGSFITKGPTYNDFAQGSGNVWSLAMRFNDEDKLNAIKSLCACYGVPYTKDYDKEKDYRDKTSSVLEKIRKAFPISKAPQDVKDYIKGRGISDKTVERYLSFVPVGGLKTVLTQEEIDLSMMHNREGLLTLWYYNHGALTYYCNRDIKIKDFKKAYTKSGLQHVMWNIDDMYSMPNVIYAEGMFDCLSLIDMGYGVISEITCNPIKEHRHALLQALGWRRKHHPDWTFTICFDNDAEKDGKRGAGIEATERLIPELLAQDFDVKVVMHKPADAKIDINMMYVKGFDGQLEIKKMLDNAKHISQILQLDYDMTLRLLKICILEDDIRGSTRLVDMIAGSNATPSAMKAVVDKAIKLKLSWREYYTDEIVDMGVNGNDYYVVFKNPIFGKDGPMFEVFNGEGQLIKNLASFQRNKNVNIATGSMDIIFRKPFSWVTGKPRKDGHVFNTYIPTLAILQEKDPTAEIPPSWNELMDNLFDSECKEWLNNSLGHWLQTEEKSQVIALLYGQSGTGKNSFVEILGGAIGKQTTLTRKDFNSEFTGWKASAVILLDEMGTNAKEINSQKALVKTLTNVKQSINEKNCKRVDVFTNGYVFMAANPENGHVPVTIDRDDRRISVLTNKKSQKLKTKYGGSFELRERLKKEVDDYILYLLSRPIDKKMALECLDNEDKRYIVANSDDEISMSINAWLDEHITNDDKDILTAKNIAQMINWRYGIPTGNTKENERHMWKNIWAKDVIPYLNERKLRIAHNSDAKQDFVYGISQDSIKQTYTTSDSDMNNIDTPVKELTSKSNMNNNGEQTYEELFDA